MSSKPVNRNFEEHISRGAAYAEIYADIAQKLEDKELFVLCYLANLRKSYDAMKEVVSLKFPEASLLDLSDAATITDIAKETKIDQQYVRKVIYAFDMIGLITKKRMRNNAQEWRITPAGGQVLNLKTNLESGKQQSLMERYKLFKK